MLKKGLIAGTAVLVIQLIFSLGLGLVFPSFAKEYQTPLFRLWTDPLMMLFFLYPFILGFVGYYLWEMLSKQFSGDWKNKAFDFAKVYFIIATIPGMFITLTSFNISYLMVGVWTLMGFLNVLVAGAVFAKLK